MTKPVKNPKTTNKKKTAEEKRETRRKYTRGHGQQIAEQKKRHYQKHKDEKNAISLKYYYDNHESMIQRQREYRRMNRERINAQKPEAYRIKKELN